MLLGSLALACAPVERAEAEVAVGDERAHSQFPRDREGVLIVVLGLVDGEGTARGGSAEHVQRGGSITALTSLPGEGQRPLGGGRCLIDAITLSCIRSAA